MKPFPLTPSTGTLPENQIVGRESDITNVLRQLRAQSVTVEEIRRMGKTLMLKKLMHLCNNDLLPPNFQKTTSEQFIFHFKERKI